MATTPQEEVSLARAAVRVSREGSRRSRESCSRDTAVTAVQHCIAGYLQPVLQLLGEEGNRHTALPHYLEILSL